MQRQMQDTHQSLHSENIIHKRLDCNIYVCKHFFWKKNEQTPNIFCWALTEMYKEPESLFFKSKKISAYF